MASSLSNSKCDRTQLGLSSQTNCCFTSFFKIVMWVKSRLTFMSCPRFYFVRQFDWNHRELFHNCIQVKRGHICCQYLLRFFSIRKSFNFKYFLFFLGMFRIFISRVLETFCCFLHPTNWHLLLPKILSIVEVLYSYANQLTTLRGVKIKFRLFILVWKSTADVQVCQSRSIVA